MQVPLVFAIRKTRQCMTTAIGIEMDAMVSWPSYIR